MKQKYFESVDEESIIIQALQLAKNTYKEIRDGSSGGQVMEEMEARIKTINKFMSKTIQVDEDGSDEI